MVLRLENRLIYWKIVKITSFLGENDVINQNHVMWPKNFFDQNASKMLFVEYVEIGGPPKSGFFGIFDFPVASGPLRALNFADIYFRGFRGLLEKIKFRGNLFSQILLKKKFHGNLFSRFLQKKITGTFFRVFE